MSVDSNVILNFEEAQGRVHGHPVEIPTLQSTARVLLTLGADRILVPAFEHKTRISETIGGLPPTLRGRVKAIDSSASVLKRVESFVRPLRRQVVDKDDMCPESVLVRQTVPFLYQLSLGAKYSASPTGSWVDDLTHSLHTANLGAFQGEARDRMALLANVVLAYSPYISNHLDTIGYAADSGVHGKVLEMLDSAEFQDVVSATGYLGLATKPVVALRRIHSAVSRVVARPAFKKSAKATEAISTLAGHPLPVSTAIAAIGGGQADRHFSPPLVELDPFRQSIFDETMSSTGTDWAPNPGSRFQIHVHQPAICGNIWADSHSPRPKVNAEARFKALVSCHRTALEALTGLDT